VCVYYVGQKEKRKKEISPFVNVSSSSNLFLFGHKTREKNTRKEETKKNKFFQRRQNSLVLAAKFI